jgi:uncharacterized membrane protein YgdD (TMEM256/DUF423 family)
MFTLKKGNVFLFATISGFLVVAIGAFGAHTLKDTLVELSTYESFQTGLKYQMFHTIVLFIIPIIYKDYLQDRSDSTSIFFIMGIILFSFSLYLYSISKITQFAMITPFGGILFLIGWFMLMKNIIKAKKID